MRYYKIVVSDPTSGQVIVPQGFEGLLDDATYTSFANGKTLSAAWNVEIDVPVGPEASPLGGALVRIWGISLSEIGQAKDLVNKKIAVYGGMQKGLPLANPAQSGLLIQGWVFQAFGNWVGTDMTLDLVVMPGDAPVDGKPGGTGSISRPLNLTLNWKSGEQLSESLTSTLQTAFSGYEISVNVSSKLVPSGDQVGYYQTLTQLAQYLRAYSKSVVKDEGYAGVEILVGDRAISVYDGTVDAGTEATEIEFVDLIGQPTWIEAPLIQFKCVMRADLKIGGAVTLPQGAVTNTAAAQTSLVPNQSLTFQGEFLVQQMRHLGNFRQADAASWVTIVNAAPKSLGA